MTVGRTTKRVLAVLASAATAILGVLLLAWAAITVVTGQPPEWRSTTLACTQPEAISYEQGSSYAVFISTPTLSLALNPGPTRAVVSRASDGNYGVNVDLVSRPSDGQVTCRWEAGAVEIVEPNDISHRVPATEFTGGR